MNHARPLEWLLANWDGMVLALVVTFSASTITMALKGASGHGMVPRFREFMLECTTANGNYAVGDQLNLASTQGSEAGTTRMSVLTATRNGLRLTLTSSSAFVALDPALFGGIVLTASSWKYKFIADRGWG